MKTKKIKLAILLSGVFLGSFLNAKSQTCVDFSSATYQVAKTVNDTTYTTVDYTSDNIDFRVKYKNVFNMFPTPTNGTCDFGNTGIVYPNDFNPNADSSGMWFGNVGVEVDFQNLGYSNKKISYDILGAGRLGLDVYTQVKVNGNLLSSLPTSFSYSFTFVGINSYSDSTFNLEITGPIQTIEMIGFEWGIDNLCTQEDTSVTVNNCLGFGATSYQVIKPQTDSTYTTVDYTSDNIDFRVKYKNVFNMFPTPTNGTCDFGNTGIVYPNDFNPNADSSGMWFGNVGVEVDFQNLGYSNKKISYDILGGGRLGLDIYTQVKVNGNLLSSLPAGFSYLYTFVGLNNYSNDSTFNVEITGPIQTIEMIGFEWGIDNLCVENLDSNSCNLTADFSYVINGNVVDFTSNGLNVSHEWDFGDGNYSIWGISQQHTYSSSGTYNVTLLLQDLVTDSTGQCRDSITKSIVISPAVNSGTSTYGGFFAPSNNPYFTLPCGGTDTKIYNQNGMLVKNIASGVLHWDGTDNMNNALPTGVYYIQCGTSVNTTIVTLFR